VQVTPGEILIGQKSKIFHTENKQPLE